MTIRVVHVVPDDKISVVKTTPTGAQETLANPFGVFDESGFIDIRLRSPLVAGEVVKLKVISGVGLGRGIDYEVQPAAAVMFAPRDVHFDTKIASSIEFKGANLAPIGVIFQIELYDADSGSFGSTTAVGTNEYFIENGKIVVRAGAFHLRMPPLVDRSLFRMSLVYPTRDVLSWDLKVTRNL